MSTLPGAFALDGHDGAGKTTLALWLANAVSGTYRRPFSGQVGAALLEAAASGDDTMVIRVGRTAIEGVIADPTARRPIILDRGWMTVASLVRWDLFSAEWSLKIATALLWADLKTTISRLNTRIEVKEDTAAHEHYLRVYRELAERSSVPIVRTDINPIARCEATLLGLCGSMKWPDAGP